jgi:hypothetical protein
MLAWLSKRLSDSGADAVISGRGLGRFPAAEVDRLLRRRVVVERRKADTWPVCAHCDCGIGGRPIREIDGRLFACCPDDPAVDEELTEADLRRFAIDPGGLAALIAEASGFGQPLEPLAPDLWRLGRLASGRSVVVGITARALDQAGIVLLLKAAGGAPVTVVAPDPGPAVRLRFLEAGIDLVELQAALKPGAHGVDVLERGALEPAAADPRLVIERRARRVTLDGRSVHLSEQLFGLLLFLTERALKSPATVEIRAIEDNVWGAGIHRIASSVREPIRALREALAADAEEPVATRNLIEYGRNPNGYRLKLNNKEFVVLE